MLRITIACVLTIAAMLTSADAAPRKTEDGKGYSEIIKACGAKWREREDKATNKGREAWQAFRRTCTVEMGWNKAK